MQVIPLLLSICFLGFLKVYNGAEVDGLYYTQVFNNASEILQAMSLLAASIHRFIFLEEPNLLMSIYFYALIFLVVYLFRVHDKVTLSSVGKFFLVDGILLLAVILLSHWSLLNQVPRRYFVGCYVGLWFIIIYSLNRVKGVYVRVTTLCFIVATLGTLSVPWGFISIHPKTFASKHSIVKELDSLGEAGIIAEYWNSYINAVGNSKNISCTPHDKTVVRNYEIVNDVFSKSNIYVIKDSWLEVFPDTLRQFNRTLVRQGPSFELADCVLSKYEISP